MIATLSVLLTLLPNPGEFESQAIRDTALIASTEMFAFHSRFSLNLHDFLYMRSRMDEAPADSSACFSNLSEADKSGWKAANAFYRKHVAERHHRTDSLMASLRYTLGEVDGAPPGTNITEVLHVLDGAAPAYRTCWWPEHEARNRAWTTRLVDLLQVHEDTLRGLVEGYLPESWARTPIHVDVVTYASWAGANTVVNPVHIMISSRDPDYRGNYALEMIFHEAAHDILHNGNLRKVVPDPPRNLWHAILFYTVGESTGHVLEQSGVEDYNPYMFENGVFRSFHEPLRKHWTPYLDGQVGWDEAVKAVVAAVEAQREGPVIPNRRYPGCRPEGALSPEGSPPPTQSGLG